MFDDGKRHSGFVLSAGFGDNRIAGRNGAGPAGILGCGMFANQIMGEQKKRKETFAQ